MKKLVWFIEFLNGETFCDKMFVGKHDAESLKTEMGSSFERDLNIAHFEIKIVNA